MRINFIDYKLGDPKYYSARYWSSALNKLRTESGIEMPAAEGWFKENYGITFFREAKFGSEGISGVDVPDETVSLLLLKLQSVGGTWPFNDV